MNPIQECLDEYFCVIEEYGFKPKTVIKVNTWKYKDSLYKEFSFIYLNGFYSSRLRTIKHELKAKSETHKN
jgi:hypothetical protein